MDTFAAIVGILIILGVLRDAFETVVLPRRVTRFFQWTPWLYSNTWVLWTWLAKCIRSRARREAFLGYFGPLSLIFLVALWAIGLIFGFALLQHSVGSHVQLGNEPITFGRLLYHSGETFFTLGYGDITPTSEAARALAVLEAGLGFAFLGVVIGYLPTIYSSFSRREIEISLLDARAGSPPSAAELLVRLGRNPQQPALDLIMRGWERWAAEVLESHISYPVLSFFRSQHNNQSWLGALTTMLDVSSLLLVGIEGIASGQAQLTFAMARHALVDLAQVMNAKYDPRTVDRLPAEELTGLRQRLSEAGLRLRDQAEAEHKLTELRSLYEPYALAIGHRLFITLPPWVHLEKKKDNWQAGPWDRAIQARSLGGSTQRMDDHF